MSFFTKLLAMCLVVLHNASSVVSLANVGGIFCSDSHGLIFLEGCCFEVRRIVFSREASLYIVDMPRSFYPLPLYSAYAGKFIFGFLSMSACG